jgi:hypothetical protein
VTMPNGIFSVPSAFTIDVTSTSVADTGVYTITLTVSDPQPASVTQSFTVNVTNDAPRIISPPPSISMVHGKSISIPLDEYFIDNDGDTLSMTATYSLNGASALTIPGGLFSQPSSLTIDGTSAGLSDVGTYTISVIISDSQLHVATSFTLEITNASPRLISTPLAVTAP